MDQRFEEIQLLLSGNQKHPFQAARKLGHLYTAHASSPEKLGALFDLTPPVLTDLARINPAAAVYAATTIFRVCNTHTKEMGPYVSRRVKEILPREVIGESHFFALEKGTLTKQNLESFRIPNFPIPSCFTHQSPALQPCGCGYGSQS
jgi:hypothetical protein